MMQRFEPGGAAPRAAEPTADRPGILCVDDEQLVLDTLSRVLRKDYIVTLSSSGAEAVGIIASGIPFAVILSDLRMPGMDGIALLRRARELSPDSARVLLTGNGDLDAAIHGVNDAAIFRFLTKPCPPRVLLDGVREGVERYRLATAERQVLEQTLRGCIRALTDTLALANPTAFGRASRVQRRVAALGAALNAPKPWQLEVAAMLSQLGMISLSVSTVEKVFANHPLEPDEEDAVARVPHVTDQLLANIPRIEGVREIIRLQPRRFAAGDAPGADAASIIGARVLRIVVDCDALESEGYAPSLALEIMGQRVGVYDAAMLKAYRAVRGVEVAEYEVREVPLQAVLPGMRLLDDVRTAQGLLLIPKGFEMNAALHARLRSFDQRLLRAPVRITTLRTATPETVAAS